MKATTIKQVLTHGALAVATMTVLAGFVFATQQIEVRAERALGSAIAAPGKLYTAPAAQPVQMATVVITGKRS